MPGESVCSSALDVARTVCRRAERRICALIDAGEVGNRQILIYLNRLADLLWLMARWEETRRHMDRFREGARQMLARTNEEVPALADTAWAVWAGGVAATAAWRNGRDHSVDYSILFGDRAGEVRRAFDAAVDLLSAN